MSSLVCKNEDQTIDIRDINKIWDMIQIKDFTVYVVYIYSNADGEVLYVGKSFRFYDRHYFHMTRDTWASEVETVQIIVLENKADMALAEVQYILKLKPKYNKVYKYDENLSPAQLTFKCLPESHTISNIILLWYWYYEGNPWRQLLRNTIEKPADHFHLRTMFGKESSNDWYIDTQICRQDAQATHKAVQAAPQRMQQFGRILCEDRR